MNVEFRRSFVKGLEKIADARLRQRVSEVILAVESVKALADVAHVRKLRDGEGYYRTGRGVSHWHRLGRGHYRLCQVSSSQGSLSLFSVTKPSS